MVFFEAGDVEEWEMLLPDDPIEDTSTVFIIVIPISKIQFQKRLQEVSIIL